MRNKDNNIWIGIILIVIGILGLILMLHVLGGVQEEIAKGMKEKLEKSICPKPMLLEYISQYNQWYCKEINNGILIKTYYIKESFGQYYLEEKIK
jgi:hypothetical protein